MTLPIFEDALELIQDKQEEVEFSTLIRDSRDALGLKQYRAAEFIGVSCGRLKNLETGYFRDMPSNAEISSIARLYDLNLNMLEQKAKSHCEERSIRKKIRIFKDESEVQCV